MPPKPERKMHKSVALLWRYVKFAGSTVVGTVVDFLVLWLCSAYIIPDLVVGPYQAGDYSIDAFSFGEYVISPTISFEFAVFTNFVIAYWFVWRDRVKGSPKNTFWKNYLYYNLTSTSTFFVNLLILVLVERFTHLDVIYCKLVASVFTGLMNFVINERLIFNKKKAFAYKQSFDEKKK